AAVLTSKLGRKPKMVVVLVGDNPASLSYIRNKRKKCEQVGAEFELLQLENNTNEESFVQTINKLNDSDDVDGFIIQMPVPEQLKHLELMNMVNPSKDIDGFHIQNIFHLYANDQKKALLPCTPKGIVKMCDFYNIGLEGQIVKSYNGKILLKTNSGIGYEITYDQAIINPKQVAIFTSLIIRENSQVLFGFNDFESKEFFELLLGVKGVGPKSAYSLVSSIGVAQMINAILLDNKKIIQTAPGIGAKAAAQIILDLQSKMNKWSEKTSAMSAPSNSSTPASVDLNIIKESLAACSELGFKEEEVLPRINAILNSGVNSANEVIKQILKGMGQ
ncbi:helix-hairpin-helix domain-containing protein, partial [Bacteriovoracaceae bacterium]|nr:helix-hairpin-helix domain-containing protein [Bacteriovoracaceae bacterium]